MTHPLHPEEDPFILFQQELAAHVPTSSYHSQTAARHLKDFTLFIFSIPSPQHRYYQYAALFLKLLP
uniref:hypothetical protein n=1 Tax=Azospirillum argentinense TaxID=2970906 RepID=UPI0010C1546C|nr:hypothetical protein [Azospirillum argentinense]